MHCREVIEPFWWHEALPDDRLKRAKSLGLPPAALVVPVPSPYGIVGVEDASAKRGPAGKQRPLARVRPDGKADGEPRPQAGGEKAP